ncbi:hypothetical protein F5B20DRAFT_49303 [Whalleya microplaca]|nr:hypothetical protein F5B20DRAFT_49303 [Whalleya microplaca]
MSKRTTFTTISPLPAGISREVVVDFLHDHEEMIDLNPLVIARHPMTPPAHAAAEEKRCIWWTMTDKISYLPGGIATGEVTYTAAFNNLPNGVQTHCYAPMGTDIRERWTLNGTLPGEPLQPVELGIGAPRQGLYLREDVELRCNFMMSAFVKKTLKKAHGALVARLTEKAQMAAAANKGKSSNRHTLAAPSRRASDGTSAHSASEHASNHSRHSSSPPQRVSPYQQLPQPQAQAQAHRQSALASPPYGQGYPRASAEDPAMPAPLRLRSASPSSGHQQHGSGGPLAELRQGQNQNQGPRPQTQGSGSGWSNGGKAGNGHGYNGYDVQPQPPRVGGGGFAAELE